jgi:hypothetical protein
VLFEGEEQRTPATLDSTWNCPLELYYLSSLFPLLFLESGVG